MHASTTSSCSTTASNRLHDFAIKQQIHLVATSETTSGLELNLATCCLHRCHTVHWEGISCTCQHLALALDLHHGKILLRLSDSFFHTLYLLLFDIICTSKLN